MVPPLVLIPGFYGNVMLSPCSSGRRIGRNVAFSLDPTPSGMRRWRDLNEVVVDRSRGRLASREILSPLDSVDGVRDLIPELRRWDFRGRLDDALGYGYFGRVIDAAQSSGLVADETVCAVPYDYRMILQELEEFHERLIEVVERAFAASGGQRCNLVAHSLGGLLVHHFLTEMSESWKRHYLARFVPINAPFGGATATFDCVVTGDLQFEWMPREYGETFRNFSGLALTLPNGLCFRDHNEILLWENMGGSFYRGYGVEHIGDVCELIGADTQWSASTLGHRIVRSFTRSHGLPVTFVVDTSTPTSTRLYTYQLHSGLQSSCYRRDFQLGDGRVPTSSLLSIARLSSDYEIRRLPGEGHTLILQSDALLRLLGELGVLVQENRT